MDLLRPNRPQYSSVASVVMVLLLVATGCGGPPKHPSWSQATGAEQYERLMWQSLRHDDWNNVQYHLAPTFVGVDERGQSYDRAAWVDHWKSARFTEYSLAEVTVQPAGADMVVTYILHLTGTRDPRSAPGGGFRVVSVWQTVAKGWVLTTTTITPIAPIQNSP
jgi:hypothetical protein